MADSLSTFSLSARSVETEVGTGQPLLLGKQVVLILVGLIGSGKARLLVEFGDFEPHDLKMQSTFAQSLEENFPEFRRCNQDDLGDRRQVEHLARASLRNPGSSVCIDRTNFDPSQRAHWINIAREIPGTLIWVIVFDTPKDVCAARLRTRTGHPTIKHPEDALSILDRFSSQYRAPIADEGYDRIIYLQPSEQEISYSHSSLAAILHRVRDAPAVAPSVGPAVFQPSTRGSPYSRGESFRARGRVGHNVNHTGYRGASRPPTRGMNRWEALSGQNQIRAETQTSKNESVSGPETRLDGEPNASNAEGLSGV